MPKDKNSWYTSLGRCKAKKFNTNKASILSRNPAEKGEAERSQEHLRPAGPRHPGWPAWPLLMPSEAPLSQVCSSLILAHVLQVSYSENFARALKKFVHPLHLQKSPKFTTNPSLLHPSILCSSVGEKHPACLFLCSKGSPWPTL